MVTDEFFEISGHQFRVPRSSPNGHQHEGLNGVIPPNYHTGQYGSRDFGLPLDEHRYRGGRRSTNQLPPEPPASASASRHLLPESAPHVDPLSDPLVAPAADPFVDPAHVESPLSRRPLGARDSLPPAEDIGSPEWWAAQQPLPSASAPPPPAAFATPPPPPTPPTPPAPPQVGRPVGSAGARAQQPSTPATGGVRGPAYPPYPPQPVRQQADPAAPGVDLHQLAGALEEISRSLARIAEAIRPKP